MCLPLCDILMLPLYYVNEFLQVFFANNSSLQDHAHKSMLPQPGLVLVD